MWSRKDHGVCANPMSTFECESTMSFKHNATHRLRRPLLCRSLLDRVVLLWQRKDSLLACATCNAVASACYTLGGSFDERISQGCVRDKSSFLKSSNLPECPPRCGKMRNKRCFQIMASEHPPYRAKCAREAWIGFRCSASVPFGSYSDTALPHVGGVPTTPQGGGPQHPNRLYPIYFISKSFFLGE